MFEAGAEWVLGTMSGTSLDGVDAAMILTDGERVFERGRSGYRAYSEAERGVLRAALGRWQGEEGVAEAADVIEAAHAELLGEFEGAALIGFHGQTLAHDPRGKGTHQAGDGAMLAKRLGLPVAWDFRSADVAAGGEGAPLAPFYHFALARGAGTEPTAFLNLGGVGNLTWADPGQAGPAAEGALLAFDTGPANAPIDDLMRARMGQGWDAGGFIASKGIAAEWIVEAVLSEPYFEQRPPKSLDRNAFPKLAGMVSGLSDEDAAATLTALAAAAVQAGLRFLPAIPARLFVTGGGRRNKTLMAMLALRLRRVSVEPIEALSLDGDMVEAEAFAFLAARVARGLPISAPGTTGVAAPTKGGRISRP
jgi:anhydro-N-acetylmuramic acid kinase